MIRTSFADQDKAKAVVYLLRWLVTDGQKYGQDLQYAALPSAVQALAITNLKQVKSNGNAILSS